MNYKLFDTEAKAQEYSHAKAVVMGLGQEGDICQYWYGWRQTKDGKWAVQCPEGNEEPEFEEAENDN